MFGDFEAQRHWLEITLNLPVGEWYRDGPDNDLQYWGLDYPPLTAYVSFMFGWLARHIGLNSMVELWHSRGYEHIFAKLYMRLTVIVCDILLFFPSATYLLRKVVKAAAEQ